MKKRWIIFIGAMFASMIWLAAEPLKSSPSAKDDLKETALYTDLAGRQVRISRKVKRIVLLKSKDIYPLAALLGDDLPNKLIAWGPDLEIDDAVLYWRLTEKFPTLKKIPTTGSVYNDSLSVEYLVTLHPDLIIADKSMMDNGYRYIEKLNNSGLPVIYLDGPRDPLTGPQRSLLLLGSVLGLAERAQAISDYVDRRIQTVVQRIAQNDLEAPLVYLEAGNLGPQSYSQTYGFAGGENHRTSWGSVLYALKVRNVAERLSVMVPIHPEALLHANPDIIVITGQNWTRWDNPGPMELGFDINRKEAAMRLKGFAARPGWNLLSAVKNGRVYSVFHNTGSIMVFAAIQSLAKDFYPELFGDLTPEADLQEFYQLFMPISCEGTWHCSLEK